jgi:Mg-chelatase subunit ChlD
VWLLEANQVRYQELRCFVNKTSFQQEVLGIPLDWSVNPKTRKIEYIYSNMELMGQTAWQQQAIRKTSWGEDVRGWLPVYLSESHFQRALQPLEASLARMAPQLLGDSSAPPVFQPLLVLEVLPRLMKTLAVLLVDHGLQGPASEQALQGYCMLHRLFIALVMHYSELQSEIQRRLQQFVRYPRNRTKSVCPDLGLLVPLVAVSEQLGWVELIQALLGESFARQVLWTCRDVPQLAELPRLLSVSRRGSHSSDEVSDEQRALLQRLLDCSAVRRRLLSFQCCFLRLSSGPHGCSLALTAAKYDRTLGLPPLHTLRRLQQLLGACQAVNTWPGFFRSLCVTVPSPLQLLQLWAASVRTSLACGYHTARTDFSRIQASGVSSFLMRGDSFERIAFCIDISGSMQTPLNSSSSSDRRSRMDAVRSEIQQILTDHLSHRQQFSIIVFNGLATEWSRGLVQATPANVSAAVSFLHSRACMPNGSTSIAAALRLALAIPQIQAIYLISDGEDSTVDLREVSAAASAAAKNGRRATSSSIQCHTTAFCAPSEGQRLLRAIATATGGSFAAFESVPEDDQGDELN